VLVADVGDRREAVPSRRRWSANLRPASHRRGRHVARPALHVCRRRRLLHVVRFVPRAATRIDLCPRDADKRIMYGRFSTALNQSDPT